MKKWEDIVYEFKNHWRSTALFSFLAVLIVFILYLFNFSFSSEYSLILFKIIHPSHILVSAIATAAIHKKYGGSFISIILVGVFGAIIIGTLSDVLFPYLLGNLFFLDVAFQLPILNEPLKIFGVAIIGSFIGMFFGFFRASHNLHVGLSVLASMLYLMAFGSILNFWGILLSLIIIFLVVYIPCCISDIVFPILFIKEPCKDCGHWHEGHN